MSKIIALYGYLLYAFIFRFFFMEVSGGCGDFGIGVGEVMAGTSCESGFADPEDGVGVKVSVFGRIPFICPIRTAFSKSPWICLYKAIAAWLSSI